MTTAPADPQTAEEIAQLVRSGCRTAKGAAEWTGLTRSKICLLIQRGELWSFKDGRRRLIPITELRRYQAAVAMESLR